MFAGSILKFNFAEIFQKLFEGNSQITLILFALGAGTLACRRQHTRRSTLPSHRKISVVRFQALRIPV